MNDKDLRIFSNILPLMIKFIWTWMSLSLVIGLIDQFFLLSILPLLNDAINIQIPIHIPETVYGDLTMYVASTVEEI